MNRIAIFALATFAAFSLAAASCQRDDDASAPADRAGAVEPRAGDAGGEGPAFDAASVVSPATETQTPAAKDPGRFAGEFEFYRYEIVRIHNMENPLDARVMAGDRIVVEPGADGRLRFSRIDVRMADPDWLTFSGAGDPGWDPHLVLRLTSDGFAFSVGDDSDGSMEIVNDRGHANGLTGLFGMSLWYEDEDTIVYEESLWRGLLWDEDAVAIEYREITFRLVYRRIRTFAVPVTVAVRVNDREFSAPAWEVDGRHYFDIRDIAYMLAGTRAQFNLRSVDVWRPEGIAQIMRSFREPFAPTGAEMRAADRAIASVTITRETDAMLGGICMREVLQRPLLGNLSLNVAAINGGSYPSLFALGPALGFAASWSAAGDAILIDTMEPYISAHGRRVADEFLRGFPTLVDPEKLRQARERLDWAEIVWDYDLLDLNRDGIPEIIIWRSWAADLGAPGWAELFVYANGAYTRIGTLGSGEHRFFEGELGRVYLLTFFFSNLDGLRAIAFDDDGAQIHSIATYWCENTTTAITIDEVLAMTYGGDWEALRADFPEFTRFIERFDTMIGIW